MRGPQTTNIRSYFLGGDKPDSAERVFDLEAESFFTANKDGMQPFAEIWSDVISNHACFATDCSAVASIELRGEDRLSTEAIGGLPVVVEQMNLLPTECLV